MSSEQRNLPEQEHSIKAREHELFVESVAPPRPKQVKPFSLYLRETPAQPISTLAKVVLWTVGGVVLVLFLVALWRVSRHHGTRPRATGVPARTVVLRPSRSPDHEISDMRGNDRFRLCRLSSKGLAIDHVFRYPFVSAGRQKQQVCTTFPAGGT
jgi:hypothetical protein